VPELSADPLGWIGARLSDLPTLLVEAEVDPATVSADDGEALRQAVPEISRRRGVCSIGSTRASSPGRPMPTHSTAPVLAGCEVREIDAVSRDLDV